VSRFRRSLPSLAFLLALGPAASAQDAETYKESAAERTACTLDVFRLCKRYIPSRTAIADCLDRSTDLSPACEAVMHGSTAEARPPARRDPRPAGRDLVGDQLGDLGRVGHLGGPGGLVRGGEPLDLGLGHVEPRLQHGRRRRQTHHIFHSSSLASPGRFFRHRSPGKGVSGRVEFMKRL
jgi:hypothetical protein